MSSFYADDRPQYSTAINEFLFHLQFTDGPQLLIEQARSVEGGGIKGVWQGIPLPPPAYGTMYIHLYSYPMDKPTSGLSSPPVD